MATRKGLRKTGVILMLVTLVLAAFSAYVALIFHGDIDLGEGLVTNLSFPTWIVMLATPLLAIFVVMLWTLVTRPTDEPVLQEQDTADETGYIATEVEVVCSSCNQAYAVPDTGIRPLESSCPHCNAINVFGEAAAPPAEDEVPAQEPAETVDVPEPVTIEPTPPESPPAPADTTYEFVSQDIPPAQSEPTEILVRCTSCREVFGMPYSTSRPLYADCTNCGRRGILH